MHAQTDSEKGNIVLTRVAHRSNLAFDTAIPKTTRHQNRIHTRQRCGTVSLDIFRVEIVYLNIRQCLQTGVAKSFV